MKTAGMLTLSILVFFSGFCQTRQITGRVIDAETNKPVSNSTIIIFDTTTGTISNHLGFFSLKLEAKDQTLVISSIGYLTSKIEVPQVDQFKIALAKEYKNLVELDLRFFEYRELPLRSDSLMVPAQGILERNSEYKGGWEYFYNDLGHLLKTEIVSKILLDSTKQVRFTVGKEGKITLVTASSDSVFLSQFIKDAFLKLNRWQPAVQNKLTVPQHFELPIKWTQKIDSSKEIFDIIEEPAYPVGGMPEFYKHVIKEMKYPLEAKKAGVSGKVFVQFIIQEDGSISDAEVVKGIGLGCDEEAIRVVLSAPKWTPGKQKGRPVRQRMVMPLTFKLDGHSNTANDKMTFNMMISSKMKYPAEARRMGIEGWVIVKFNIEKQTGEVLATQIIKDIGAACGEEVLRTLKLIPAQNFKDLHPSKVMYVLPVGFGLGKALNFKSLNYIANDSEEVLQPVNVVAIGIEVDRKVSGPTQFSAGSQLPLIIKLDGKVLDGRPSGNFESFEQAIASSPNTNRITIIRQGLKQIPIIVNQFTSLRFLDLENNELKNVPYALTELKKLQELYLPLNQIDSLPESFGNLGSLKILGLANNKFEVFPISITRLVKLEALDLAGNQITEIPSNISNMKKLKSLFLQDNKIKNLPNEIYQLSNLEKLFLGGNSISEEDKAKLKKMLNKTEIHF